MFVWKFLILLFALSLSFADDYYAWNPVYLEDGIFIMANVVPAKSDLDCAIKTTRHKWVFLFKFENNVCEMSSQKFSPSESTEGLTNPKQCMTRIPKYGDNFCYNFLHQNI